MIDWKFYSFLLVIVIGVINIIMSFTIKTNDLKHLAIDMGELKKDIKEIKNDIKKCIFPKINDLVDRISHVEGKLNGK